MTAEPLDGTRLGRDLALLADEDPKVSAALERYRETVADIASGYARWKREMLADIYGSQERPDAP